MVATVLSVIALVVAFIPVLNFPTPVLLGLAALAAAVALALRAGKAGAAAKPMANTRTARDPIDVATGRVVLTQTDVELAGVLPLVLSRTHLSSYRVGRWFGPWWASTLDQRLEVEGNGVYYAAEDGMVLVYPAPTEGTGGAARGGAALAASPHRGRRVHHHRPAAWAHPALRTGRRRAAQGAAAAGGHRPVRASHGPRLRSGRHAGRDSPFRWLPDWRGDHRRADHRLRLRDAGDGIEREGDVLLVRYGYDGIGRLTEVANSSGISLRFDYDSAGRLTGWQDRNDVAYYYTYDETGRCVRTSGSGGCMNGTLAYDPDNRVTVVTDSLDHVTTFHLNELGQVVREVDPLGNSAVSAWDRYDRLLARTDALGRTTRYTYDEVGNLVAITRPGRQPGSR